MAKGSFRQADTLKNEGVQFQDTARMNSNFKWFGEFVPFEYLGKNSVTKSQLVLSDNVGLFDLLKTSSENLGFGIGNLGSFNPFLEYGMFSFPSVKINGSDLSIPQLGISSFEFIPILTFEKIEIFEGLEAIVSTHNSSGLMFNFTSRRFNTKLPYTQIWIGQAGYGYLGSSAVFSQNLSSNTNFLFSYQRFWSAGRYANSNSDKWNVLFGFRWNPLPNLNFNVENRYTNWGNGLWGGVNDTLSVDLFDNTLAEVNFRKLDRRIFQNDLITTYSLILNTDTTFLLDGNFSFTYSEMETESDTTVFVDTWKGFSKSAGKVFGMLNRLTVRRNQFKAVLGLDFRSSSTQSWQFGFGDKSFVPAIFGLFYFDFLKNTQIAFGSRIWRDNEGLKFSSGSRISQKLTPEIISYVELSDFPRIANYSNAKSFSPEQDLLARIGINSLGYKKINFSLSGYYHYVKNKIQFESVKDSAGIVLEVAPTQKSEYRAMGLKLSTNYWLPFGFSGETVAYINYFFSANGKLEYAPNFIFSHTIKYRYQRGNSVLDLGVNLEVLSPFSGMYYVPQQNVFVPYRKRTEWQTNGINLFASAKLGNAYVNLSFRNALGLNFYYVPIYPEYDRDFRISVFWSFFD